MKPTCAIWLSCRVDNWFGNIIWFALLLKQFLRINSHLLRWWDGFFSELPPLLFIQKKAFYIYTSQLQAQLSVLPSHYDLHASVVGSWLGCFFLFNKVIMELKDLPWKKKSVPSGIISCTALLCIIVGPYGKKFYPFFLKGTNCLILSC